MEELIFSDWLEDKIAFRQFPNSDGVSIEMSSFVQTAAISIHLNHDQIEKLLIFLTKLNKKQNENSRS